MQQTRNTFGGSGQNSVANLRAQVRGSTAEFSKPPKARKPVKRESDEERAVKAERLALAQHQTSLLAGGKSSKSYRRPGERAEKKGGGLFWQILLVVVLAGGVAYALDPSIVPAEWVGQVRSFVGQYVKI